MKTTPMRTNESAAGSTRLLHRLTAALLALVLAASAALPVFAADTAPTDTIYINSVSDLLAFADKCGFDQWSKGKTVILQEDLSLEDTEWAPVASFSGAFKGNGHTISDVSLVGLILQPASSASWKRAVPFRTLPSRVWSIPLVPRRPQAVWWAPTTAPSSTARSPVLSTARRRRAVWWAAMRRAEPSTTALPVPWSAVRMPPAASWATTSVSSPAAPMWAPSTPSIRESALDMEGLPATLLELVKKDMGDDLSNNISNVSSDTGGIAGRSSGLILSSANAGDVGYAHVGYNVGGIVGRTDGLISGCVNQGLVQGRKDVGGIAGQAEPYVELDLDQSTINRLRTELDTLHTMVNGAADDMDGSTSLLNTDLNTLNSQMDTAVRAARRLQEQEAITLTKWRTRWTARETSSPIHLPGWSP